MLRGQVDAVAVGIETALSDDPRLTARDMDGNNVERQPLRIIIDSSARTPPDSQLFREPGPVLVAVANAPEEKSAKLCAAGAQVVPVAAADGSVDPSGPSESPGRAGDNQRDGGGGRAGWWGLSLTWGWWTR